MLLEAYRDCLRDVFDLPALFGTLEQVERKSIKVVTRTTRTPSPFASSVLFGFVANYIYDGDAPLAERRAQALAIDQAQLRELLGDAELRELLDVDAMGAVESQLQQTDPRFHAHSQDGVHDLLLRVGDLSRWELGQRCTSEEVAREVEALVQAKRAVLVEVAGEPRFIAVEDAGKYKAALGVELPKDVPAVFLTPPQDPSGDLVLRYARTHAPFTLEELVKRLGFTPLAAEETLRRLLARGRVVEGAFRPRGKGREWCEAEVLANIRRRSLSKLRRDVEPVEPRVLCRMTTTWHGVLRRAHGLDGLLDVIERLQGCALPASLLESEILSVRVEGYSPADLDALLAAGEVVWCGLGPLGERDGRVALYLTDALPKLWRRRLSEELPERERRILEAL
jgi:ATP-dependent Lhr-like helicase